MLPDLAAHDSMPDTAFPAYFCAVRLCLHITECCWLLYVCPPFVPCFELFLWSSRNPYPALPPLFPSLAAASEATPLAVDVDARGVLCVHAKGSSAAPLLHRQLAGAVDQELGVDVMWCVTNTWFVHFVWGLMVVDCSTSRSC